MTLCHNATGSLSDSGKHEDSLLVCKFPINSGKGCELSLNLLFIFVFWVQKDFENFRTVHADACPLANNLSGSHNIFQDRFLHRRQCAVAWPHFDALPPEVFIENGAIGNKDQMPVAEFFLQFTDEASLDLTYGPPNTERKEHHQCPACLSHLNLLGCRYVDLPELGLDVTGWGNFNVEKRLRYCLLQLSGCSTLLFHNLFAGVEHCVDLERQCAF